MDRNQPPRLIVHPDKFIPTQVAYDLQSFFEFQFWLAGELESLVDRYRPGNALPPKVRGNKPPKATAHSHCRRRAD
jgi:hypothetical protein